MRKDIKPIAVIGDGGLPFLDRALEAGIAQIGLSVEIKSVAETRKRTGYLLKSDKWMVFLYKSSELIPALIETIEKMINENVGYQILMEPSDETVDGVDIWFDDGIFRQWTFQKKMNVLSVFVSGSGETKKTSQRRKDLS